MVTSPEVLMRTSVVERVGGQQHLAHTHDMEMWFRIAAFSDVGHIEGPDQAVHREHAQSLSNRAVSSVGITILKEKRAAFDTLFSGAASQIPDAERLHCRARLTLAREAVDAACHEFDRGRARSSEIGLLIKFAVETAPDITHARDWAGLQRRMRLGPKRVGRRPWYVAQAVMRRLATDRRYRRWARWGVYERS